LFIVIAIFYTKKKKDDIYAQPVFLLKA